MQDAHTLVRVMSKGCAGKAARQPNEHRLLAAIERQRLKGMSATTARVWLVNARG